MQRFAQALQALRSFDGQNVHKPSARCTSLAIAPIRARSTTDEVAMPSKQMNSDSRLVFTSSEAADYIGVSLATIRRWTDAGYVACYRTPGGQRRFSSDQLDEFIASLHRGENPPAESRATATPAESASHAA
jgi:excisionase family DNA binding protein